MLKFLVAMLGLVSSACFSATEIVPGPILAPAAEKAVVENTPTQAALSNEELKYVHGIFRQAVINDCLNALITADYDKNSGVVTHINHTIASPLGIFVMVQCFKTGDEFEKELFAAVYKDADARNKVRVWDVNGEANFLRAKIDAKIKDDAKFGDEILSALKETVKAAETPKGK